MITKPANIYRGISANFELDIAALKLRPAVANDGYFSDSANWQCVTVTYKSTVRKQYETIRFSALGSFADAKFLISEKSVGNFSMENVVIYDFDGGKLVLRRSDFVDPTVFDVTITTPEA